MTIAEILAEVDELKPNQYDDKMKIKWISEVDFTVFEDLISTHAGADIFEFNGYTENDMSETVLVPDSHCDIYRYYIFSMIDLINQETDRYQNSAIMFNNAKAEYFNYYSRTHEPLYVKLGVF